MREGEVRGPLPALAGDDDPAAEDRVLAQLRHRRSPRFVAPRRARVGCHVVQTGYIGAGMKTSPAQTGGAPDGGGGPAIESRRAFLRALAGAAAGAVPGCAAPGRRLPGSPTMRPAEQGVAVKRFVFAQLRHRGADWEPHPAAVAEFVRDLERMTSVEAAPERVDLDAGDPRLFSHPFLCIRGTREFPRVLRRARSSACAPGSRPGGRCCATTPRAPPATASTRRCAGSWPASSRGASRAAGRRPHRLQVLLPRADRLRRRASPAPSSRGSICRAARR